MYTQRIRREDIPSNYSGNAFRYPPIGSLAVPQGEDISQEDMLMQRDAADQSNETKEEADTQQLDAARVPSSITALAPRVTGEEQTYAVASPTSALPLLKNGIGGEELLLIGLFLLLSGGGDKDAGRRDILPYLLALIFCA